MRLPLVTSLGMVSCLGPDVVSSCAAARAGILRFGPIEGTSDPNEVEWQVALKGAPVRGITDGFIQTGRWLRLAVESITDLIRYGALPPPSDTRFWASTGLIWVLPELAFDRFLWPEPEISQLLESSCGMLLRELVEVPFFPLHEPFVTVGHTGVAAALERIERLSSPLERVVLLAVDSLLDPLSLKTLEREQRLKSTGSSVGLLPGEASACVLLEGTMAARHAGRQAKAQVISFASRPAVTPINEEDPGPSRVRFAVTQGRALAEAVLEALQLAGERGPFNGDVILDLNGEEWKALVWGHAVVRLRSSGMLGSVRDVLPCTSFGELGAASAGVGLCMATRAFLRGYALGDRALVLSISDQGAVSAVLLARAAN
jgi:3-oxoacyl-[acyl-carrier-protein] synthase-1